MAGILFEETDALGTEPGYRSYVSGIDKALKSFECTSDWADLISSLAKLNKVLHTHSKYNVIPRKTTICKRLAQCTHPALPSGVHLKALETYDIIFKSIGPAKLGQDMFIYSCGLFPLLAHAAMNVKFCLLDIYEKHFIILGRNLRVGLNGFLIGVLPGLEEGSDFHKRTETLLQKICESVGKEYFYECLWKCILSNSPIRHSAINFIIDHYDKKILLDDQLYILGSNVGVMVQALCGSLQDYSVLVQRCTLDLLLLSLPVHTNHLLKGDMLIVVTAAITVLLRRDISLNRRLFSWLLGKDFLSSTQQATSILKKFIVENNSSYFNKHSSYFLIEAMRLCLKISCSKSELAQKFSASSSDIWCYKLLISLLDHPIIGAFLLNDLLIDVFRSLYFKCFIEDTEKKCLEEQTQFTEVVKTANLLFTSMDPGYLWAYMAKLFEEACQNESKISPSCHSTHKISSSSFVQPIGSEKRSTTEISTLLDFLMDLIPLEMDLQAREKHLPELLNSVIDVITLHCCKLSSQSLFLSLNLCSKILFKMKHPSSCYNKKNEHDVSNKKYNFSVTHDNFLNAGVAYNEAICISEDKNCFMFSRYKEKHPGAYNYDILKNSNICGIDAVSYIKMSLQKFKLLLSTFLKDKFLTDFNETLFRYETFIYYSNGVSRHKELPIILNSCLDSELLQVKNSQVTFDFSEQKCDSSKSDLSIFQTHLNDEKIPKEAIVCGVFEKMCRLLTDLSHFSTEQLSLEKETGLSDIHGNLLEETRLQEWLKLFISVACFADMEEVSFAAIKALLELISLTLLCSNKLEFSDDHDLPKNQYEYDGIATVISSSELQYICQKTRLFYVISLKLWRCIDCLCPDIRMNSVELLQQMHNISSGNSFCEAVLSSVMTSFADEELLYTQEKFIFLWHLTRANFMKSSAISRSFDQCLFILLDKLGNENGPVKISVQTWLNNSFYRGDTARIFEPILLILAQSNSSRVSVQHVNVHISRIFKDTLKQCESKLYTISSTSGTVMYHFCKDKEEFSSLSSNEKVSSSFVQHIRDYAELPSNFDTSLSFSFPVSMNSPGTWHSFNSNSNLDYNSDPNFSTDTPRTHRHLFDGDDEEEDTSHFQAPFKNHDLTHLNPEEVIQCIINNIILNVTMVGEDERNSYYFEVFDNCSLDENKKDIFEKHTSPTESEFPDMLIHPHHTHILLYSQIYDAEKAIYALSSLKAILQANPRLALCCVATTNFSNSFSFQGQKLQISLARHRQSIFGNNFHGEISSETTGMYRSSTFLETIILISLYYIRSYYPNMPKGKLSLNDILGNRRMKFVSMEVLMLIFSELSAIVKDCGKNFASYMNDLLSRCKVQKTLLHILNANVFDSPLHGKSDKYGTFTEAIVAFNDYQRTDEVHSDCFQLTFQVQILKLITTLIALEEAIYLKMVDEKSSSSVYNKSCENSYWSANHIELHVLKATKYQQGLPLKNQLLLLKLILLAMSNEKYWDMHLHWLSFVISILPFCGQTLSQLITSVTIYLCHNLHKLKVLVEGNKKCSTTLLHLKFPPDYVITLIEGLTTICHYCLLDFPVASYLHPGILAPLASQSLTSGISASQIISNLFHVFSSASSEKDNFDCRDVTNIDSIHSTRRTVLSNLPQVIKSLSAIYHLISIEGSEDNKVSWLMVGPPKVVKQQILSFLSPISLNYGTSFICAVSIVWYEQRSKNNFSEKEVIPQWSAEQLHLVNLVSAIKALPLESVVLTVKNIIKQQPSVSAMDKVPVEVSTLQFFLAYIQKNNTAQLGDSLQSLLSLWRDGLQFASHLGQFHLLAILHEFVQRAPVLEDKKSRKDLQDIAHKLIDACNVVASASLEQTTWLWKSLRPLHLTDLPARNDCENEKFHENSNEDIKTRVRNDIDKNYQSEGSIKALNVLAKLLAPVLDFIYLGEEKEKAIPLLSNIMHYVTPYLKDHSSLNSPHFTACCELLSSLSGYQHTRKAWRKDVFELLIDVNFFKMPAICISYWKDIIDHLMTYDKTTFQDFMARLSVLQTGSLNLFSSKEQEYEQRAQLLKRLSFILFCSEVDQYEKFMPDIQERLTESLKLAYVPPVSAQVFLCFRVLLLRMSAQHVTSLWPIIFSEMVHVFMMMEYDLSESSQVSSCGENIWLDLYLYACKLLDVAVALPESLLPQFQMYQWAFIGDNCSADLAVQSNNKKEFVPYAKRLASLLDSETTEQENPHSHPFGKLILTVPHIKNLQQLSLFFKTLSQPPRLYTFFDLRPELFSKESEIHGYSKKIQQVPTESSVIRDVENTLELDFIDKSLHI